MNDKDLAKAVIALGVGRQGYRGGVPTRFSVTIESDDLDAADFVRDWRVAGALMERCRDIEIYNVLSNDGEWEVGIDHVDLRGDSLPRSIIEACCLALEEK